MSGSMFVCLMYDTLPPQLQPCSNSWRACCMLYVVWHIAQSTDFRKVKKKKDHAHSPFSMSLLGAIKPQPSCFKLQPSKPSSTRDRRPCRPSRPSGSLLTLMFMSWSAVVVLWCCGVCCYGALLCVLFCVLLFFEFLGGFLAGGGGDMGGGRGGTVEIRNITAEYPHYARPIHITRNYP